MGGDWIKLHRKMLENPVVMKDPEHLAVWIYLLSEAAWKAHDTMFGGRKIELKPGQFVTGRKKIAEKTGVNESKVFRILKHFENDQQIEQQTERYGTLISIVNWNKYQSDEQQSEQQVNNNRTTSEQQVNTTEEKKEREERKERKKYIAPTLGEVEAYCMEKGYEYVEPAVFWNFYESKNWMVGKNKMSDWHKALAGWNSRNRKKQKSEGRLDWIDAL